MKTDKKILLINPSYRITETSKPVLRLEPPVALLNLATFLLDKGFVCDIVNTSFEDIDWNKVRDGHYFLAGFTVFIGEFMKNAGEFSAEIKKINPSMPIVWGGTMASIIPGEILSRYPVDYVVRYEGEYTLHELAEALTGGGNVDDIAGLSHRKNGDIIHNAPRPLENDLDNFPVAKWELFGANTNERQVPYYFRIMSSKGCPFNCSFCYKHGVDEALRKASPVWRYRSAGHVISEIEDIRRQTGARVFTFGDDNFLVARQRTRDILKYFRENGLYIEQLIAHVNNLTDENIAGLSGIAQTAIYAIETASPSLQKLIGKKLRLDRVPDVNKKLFDNGITTIHNFIIGFPTETDADLRLNVEMMLRLKEINPFVRAVAYLILPLPATPLTEYIEKDLGLHVPCTIDDYEHANFDSGYPEGIRFRPWLDPDRYGFLHRFSVVFGDAFQVNNLELSEESRDILSSDAQLREIFACVESVRRPSAFYMPYVLDRVLKGETVDLVNDLKKHI